MSRGSRLPTGPWLDPADALALLDDDPPVVYQLRIVLRSAVRLNIPALDRPCLAPGTFIYSGSARRHARARLARHLRRRKPRRWHIDHLLARREARIVAIRLWPWQPGLECRVNQAMLRGGRIPTRGFGSSDCTGGCAAHLVWLRDAADNDRQGHRKVSREGLSWPG